MCCVYLCVCAANVKDRERAPGISERYASVEFSIVRKKSEDIHLCGTSSTDGAMTASTVSGTLSRAYCQIREQI